MDVTALWDALGAGIVLGGTVLATIVGSGRQELSAALASLVHMVRRPFAYERARAEIAREVETVKTDGVLRARGFATSDEEISSVTRALIHDRSIGSLIEAHERFKRQRGHARKLALRPIRLAADMAPVFGMAGTLLSLSQLDYGADGGGMAVASIGLAIVTTLYGLMLAHLVFHPLASLVERRGAAEEEERQMLIDWLARQLAGAVPPSRSGSSSPPRLERVV